MIAEFEGITLGLDDVKKELEDYQENFQKEKEKTARNNKILFIILIIIIIIFILALWRYQLLH